MRVTVLGSSGGYPAPGSACSGYLVEADETRLWIDAGSGTLSRLLGICPLSNLSAAVISHLHADHWTDLPLALHTLRFAVDRDGPMPVHGPAGWPRVMGIVAEWAEEDPPVFAVEELSDRSPVVLGTVSIEPIRVRHSDLETFGLRIEDGASTLAYSADSGPCEELDELARDADLFVCEAGAPEGEQPGMHLTGHEAGEIAARAGARRLLLTHLAPSDDGHQTLAQARKAFDGRVELAAEGLSLDV